MDRGFNVFVGANAQGKTNFLEAVVALSDGRSFRGGKITDMIDYNSHEALVEGEVNQNGKDNTLRIQFSKKGRQYFWNGKSISDLREYLGRVSFVVFSAEYLNIASGEPKIRRDLLDRGVFSLEPHYLILLREYAKVLKSRNALLKSATVNHELLEIYTEKLVDSGVRIIQSRLTYLDRIREQSRRIYREISRSDEELDLEYQCSCAGIKVGSDDPADFRGNLRNQVVSEKEKDLFRGSTSTGPHRDDLKMTINGNEIKQFGSRGQKRTAVVAIKFAELATYQEKKSDNPILVLDDIGAELDVNRQMALFEYIPEGVQTLISHTAPLDIPKNRKYFYMENGKIRQDDAVSID